MSMILVVGSTGVLGSDICKQLIVEGKSVRALVRSTSDPAKVERLKSLGAQIVEGDVRDRASLDRIESCRGRFVHHVFPLIEKDIRYVWSPIQYPLYKLFI